MWNTVKRILSITIENDHGVLVCLYPTQAGVALTNTSVQGRSQDFSVGTHSFPSHLFTPPPPPQKKIKVIFDSRVFYFKSRAQES